MHRLHRNHGGYHGEAIDLRAAEHDVEAAAAQHGWISETFHADGDFKWLALHRQRLSTLNPSASACSYGATAPKRSEGGQPSTRVYISTGIHGDEPAGPLAALRLLQENRWPDAAEIWLLPCLNPTGLARNKRENANGVDLNRDYLHLQSDEVRAHIAWLQRQPNFDLCLCLHEDWESHGFYVYELNPDKKPSLAEVIVAEVEKCCPVDPSELIEGREASGGIIRPHLDPRTRPQWPEAFWLITHKTRLSYTLEAPSDFPLNTRVDALVAGVNAALIGAPSTASARRSAR